MGSSSPQAPQLGGLDPTGPRAEAIRGGVATTRPGGADPPGTPPAGLSRKSEHLLWCWWAGLIAFACAWQFQWVRLAPGVFAILCLVWLAPVLALEFRSRLLSAFLERVLADRGRTALLLTLLLAAAVKFYGLPGYRLYTMGDGPPHFVNAWIVHEALRHGQVPIWTNEWACGSPFLQFYPPLFPFLTAGLLFLRLDAFTAVRLLLALFHFLSGVAMYRLVRGLTAGRGAALVSALCYALAPWHVFQLFHFNRFPVALVYTLLPLLLLSTEIVCRDRLAALLLGSLSLAGIALSHQGYAIFAAILFGVYTLFRLVPTREDPGFSRPALLLHLAGTGVLGIGLASFLLVPYVPESRLLPFLPSLGKGGGVEGFLMDNPYLATLFAWRRQPVGHSGYLGISLFLLSLAGVSRWAKRRGPAWVALLVCYAFSYYLVLGHENRFYSLIPFVYSQFYAGRYLIFLVLFLSVCAGLACDRLGPGPDGYRAPSPRATFHRFLFPRLLLVALAFIALDLGPISTYVQVSPRHPLADLGPLYAAIREKRAADPRNPLARAVDLPRDFRSRNHGSLVLPFEAGCPTPEAGQFGTLGSYAYIYKILKNARENLPWEQGFPEALRQALLLLNVRYLFTDIFPAATARELGGENFGGNLWLFTFPGSAPVISSSCVEGIGESLQAPANPVDFVQDRWDPPDAVERLVNGMEIDLATRLAARIPVRSGPDCSRCLPGPAGPVTVGEQKLRANSLRLSLTAPSPCFLHLSHSWYPHLRVLIDGKACDGVLRSALDFIVVPFPAGTHSVEVQAVLSPLRRTCLAASGLCLAAWVFLSFLWGCRRMRRNRPRRGSKHGRMQGV